jgi:hypothetical protein
LSLFLLVVGVAQRQPKENVFWKREENQIKAQRKRVLATFVIPKFVQEP